MKNNNLLTYILYGLLAVIITIAGYYTCQRQKEKKIKQEQDEAELQQTLRDMGYAPDTASTSGSSFVSGDGIETANPTSETGDQGKPTATQQPGSSTQQPATTVKQPTTSTAPNTVTKAKSAVDGPGSGRWAVRAGTFSYMAGARRRLEEVIQLGYTNAEISKTSSGKAAVVVFRSNDKNAANSVADKLAAQGIDAAVFARR